MPRFLIKSGNDNAFVVIADHTLDALTKLVTYFNDWPKYDALEYADAVARFDENRFIHVEPIDISDDDLKNETLFSPLDNLDLHNPNPSYIFETNIHDHHWLPHSFR